MFLTAVRLAAGHFEFRVGKEIFVRSLPWTCGKHDLKQHFEAFGEVIASSVAYDRNTGLSLGYGFVRFADEDSANKALRAPKHVIEGYRVIASEARRDQRETNRSARPQPNSPFDNQYQPPNDPSHHRRPAS